MKATTNMSPQDWMRDEGHNFIQKIQSIIDDRITNSAEQLQSIQIVLDQTKSAMEDGQAPEHDKVDEIDDLCESRLETHPHEAQTENPPEAQPYEVHPHEAHPEAHPHEAQPEAQPHEAQPH